MDELDSISDPKLFSAEFRLLGEQLAHVNTGASDSEIARPGAQHLARTAAQIKHPRPGLQPQGRAERGEFVRGHRVVDAMGAFGDVENAGDLQGGILQLL
ncbi:hypothetical protein SDC9_142072 [bioreactor metagenome]|uniref:Uncharacterized protein n=1 Tax=bioreactor metagenome TaxID=1076179 RepID=A0A645E268_9ZZZZ